MEISQNVLFFFFFKGNVVDLARFVVLFSFSCFVSAIVEWIYWPASLTVFNASSDLMWSQQLYEYLSDIHTIVLFFFDKYLQEIGPPA